MHRNTSVSLLQKNRLLESAQACGHHLQLFDVGGLTMKPSKYRCVQFWTRKRIVDFVSTSSPGKCALRSVMQHRENRQPRTLTKGLFSTSGAFWGWCVHCPNLRKQRSAHNPQSCTCDAFFALVGEARGCCSLNLRSKANSLPRNKECSCTPPADNTYPPSKLYEDSPPYSRGRGSRNTVEQVISDNSPPQVRGEPSPPNKTKGMACEDRLNMPAHTPLRFNEQTAERRGRGLKLGGEPPPPLKARKTISVFWPAFPLYARAFFPCNRALFLKNSHSAGPALQEFGFVLRAGVWHSTSVVQALPWG